LNYVIELHVILLLPFSVRLVKCGFYDVEIFRICILILAIGALDCGDRWSAEAASSEWPSCQYSIIQPHWCTQSDCAYCVSTSRWQHWPQVVTGTECHFGGWNCAVHSCRWSVGAS